MTLLSTSGKETTQIARTMLLPNGSFLPFFRLNQWFFTVFKQQWAFFAIFCVF